MPLFICRFKQYRVDNVTLIYAMMRKYDALRQLFQNKLFSFMFQLDAATLKARANIHTSQSSTAASTSADTTMASSNDQYDDGNVLTFLKNSPLCRVYQNHLCMYHQLPTIDEILKIVKECYDEFEREQFNSEDVTEHVGNDSTSDFYVHNSTGSKSNILSASQVKNCLLYVVSINGTKISQNIHLPSIYLTIFYAYM